MADTLDQMQLTLLRKIGKRLRYKDLTKANGLDSGVREMAI